MALSHSFSTPIRHLLSHSVANTRSPILTRLAQFTLPPLTIPTSLSIPIGSLLQDLWDGLLLAVPKKKTTHSKSRSRRLAGKGLKDVTSLNTCSACGRVKRMHVLCPYCVQSKLTSIRDIPCFHACLQRKIYSGRPQRLMQDIQTSRTCGQVD